MAPWLKLWPEKLFSPEWYLLSPQARATLAIALPATARARERGDMLTIEDLQRFTGIPMKDQENALRELIRRRFATIEGADVTVPLYDVMQAKVDNTRYERVKEWREKQRGSAAETPLETPSETPSETPKIVSETGQEEQKYRDIPPNSPSGELPPVGVTGPKRVRPEVPDVAFDESDEARVHGILTIEASANKSNTLAVSKVKTLRFEMRTLLDEVGSEVWRYALDEALSRAKPFAYGRAIAKTTAKKVAAGGAIPFTSAPGSSRGRNAVAPTFDTERPVDESVGRFREIGAE